MPVTIVLLLSPLLSTISVMTEIAGQTTAYQHYCVDISSAAVWSLSTWHFDNQDLTGISLPSAHPSMSATWAFSKNPPTKINYSAAADQSVIQGWCIKLGLPGRGERWPRMSVFVRYHWANAGGEHCRQMAQTSISSRLPSVMRVSPQLA